MNEYIKDASDIMLRRMLGYLETGAHYLQDEAPEYLEEFYRLSLIKCWMDLVIYSILLCLVIYFSYFSIRKVIETVPSYECPFIYGLVSTFGPFVSIFLSVAVIHETQKLITLYIAPRVFLMNHLREMIK